VGALVDVWLVVVVVVMVMLVVVVVVVVVVLFVVVIAGNGQVTTVVNLSKFVQVFSQSSFKFISQNSLCRSLKLSGV
jgi:hypothetical protein